MAEYTAKFLRLSQYLSEMVPDKERKAHKFQWKLCRDIGSRFVALRLAKMP